MPPGRHGLQYSVVDMTRERGLGDIVTKNIPLLAPATEKVSATLLPNQQDLWVVTHAWESDEFYAFRVTETGVDADNPVVSAVGAMHEGATLNAAGYLKIAPDGSRLALAIPQDNNSYVQVLDF